MKTTNTIIDSLNISVSTDEIKYSFYLPAIDGCSKNEVVFHSEKQKGNVIIFSAQRLCRIIPTQNYNTVFVNFSLRDPVFDALIEHVKISKDQVMNSLLQSDSNAGIIIFLEDDIFFVDVIKTVKFVRESVRSDIPIKIYVLSPKINDIFYTKLMLLSCDCIAPFMSSTIYGAINPQTCLAAIATQEEKIKQLPVITNNVITEKMDFATFWEYNYDSYEIETLFSIVSKNNNFSLEREIKDFIVPEKGQKYQEEPFDIDIFPDIEMHFTLAVLWKHFARIIYYINSIAGEINIQLVYKNVLRKLDDETAKSKYKIFYESICEYLPMVFNNPQREDGYPIKKQYVQPELYQNAFCYYHLFSRIIAMIAYGLNHIMDRERKEKVAMKIMYILKKDIGIFPIPIYLENKWQERNILEIFKHFRKNNL